MLFNSFVFILVFLPITCFVYGLAIRIKDKSGIWILILSSLVFYAYWNEKYLCLLLISIFINFLLQKWIYHNKKNMYCKLVLCIGILLNLFLIGYYKYYNFLLENMAEVFCTNFVKLDIFLPLGISFFTFQQIACLVDTYKGDIGNVSVCEYVLFVTFFPQLIAGPIVRATDIIPQMQRIVSNTDSKAIKFGLTLFAFGLFKKVVIADYFSPIANALYSSPEIANFYDALLGSLSYTMQIYFDFSGYSDMAIGLGLLFGIRLPINFDSPYKSKSIIEFWRRWHMTLSQFLRDYLYIPLGGSRKGERRQYINLIATMLLGGLWHGAGWTFVLWGGTHGVYLICNHWWRKKKYSIGNNKAWLITFISIWFAWILFRSNNVYDVFYIVEALGGNNGFAWGCSMLSSKGYALSEIVLVLLLSIVVCKYLPDSYNMVNKIQQLKQPIFALIAGVLLTYAMHIMTYTNRVSEFLYFQF